MHRTLVLTAGVDSRSGSGDSFPLDEVVESKEKKEAEDDNEDEKEEDTKEERKGANTSSYSF